jgi:hypothetical protein
VRALRVGAFCRGSSWFPRADNGLAPSFEIMEDVAAPRRGILRAQQTFAGRRKPSCRDGGDFGGDRSERSGHGLLGGEGAIPSCFPVT